MAVIERVLPSTSVADLADYVERERGGRAVEVARSVEPGAVIDELEAAGLRGRGGAGFPTGRKWRTVLANRSDVVPATVVVNAAEGEPGTFKDRAILRANPYHVLEGALVAAVVVGADEVVVGLKATFAEERRRLTRAIEEITEAGWAPSVRLSLLEGPSEYLYGEETALLEVAAGRPPLPRIAPPYRRGVDEVVDSVAAAESESGLAAPVEMAGEGGAGLAPPTLVDNVETLANVPAIVVKGSEWFRSVGTAESPGTVVCTVTGRVRQPGVAEVAMGTPLAEAIEEAGGGVSGRRVTAVVPGVSNAFIAPDDLYVPLTYEALAAIGSGLGSAGFIVLDETDDVVAAAAGVSRFLAVESCGQCTPCKQDGLAMAERLARIARREGDEHDLEALLARTATVGDGARCNLALQQQAVMAGLTAHWSRVVDDHLAGRAPVRPPMVVAELVDIDAEDGAVVDVGHAAKQPDWTYDESDSGTAPADRLLADR